jgi:hypothetical protein
MQNSAYSAYVCTPLFADGASGSGHSDCQAEAGEGVTATAAAADEQVAFTTWSECFLLSFFPFPVSSELFLAGQTRSTVEVVWNSRIYLEPHWQPLY